MDALAVTTSAPVQVGLLNADAYNLAKKIALDLSVSDLIPARYQQKPANCLIALNMANRIGADPLMVMQNLYVVHGTPAWSAQFLIAAFNSTPGFSKLRYEFKGQEGTDEWSCRAWAIEKATEARLDGAWVSIGIAKEEGWSTKNGSKWKTMPQQMLMYRAAAWFVRAYAPEIAMGLQTSEEVADTYDLEPDGQGSYAAKPALSAAADLNAKVFDQQPQPTDADPANDPQSQTAAQTRNKPTQAEMDQRRGDAKAAVLAAGLELEAVEKDLNAYQAKWTTAQCERAHKLAEKAMAQREAQPQAQADETVECPNSGSMVRLAVECAGCDQNGLCPATDGEAA